MPALPPIDPDIRLAQTLPGRFYRDPEVYDALKEKLLVPSWHWVGQAMELEPNQARPFELLPGCLDEPLLLLKDKAGELRCMSNVCTHRGCVIQTQPGECRALRCGYHGRRFEQDGRFKHMPGFEETENFPRPEDSLPAISTGTVCGALFASLAPSQSFEEWSAPLHPLLERLPEAEFEFDASRAASYVVSSHWALYVDNFLEGFHIPYVHPGLAQTLVDDDYENHLFPTGTLQIGIARAGEPAFEAQHRIAGEERPVAAYYYWLTPTTMFNFYPWGLSVNVLEPLGVDSTRVHFKPYVWRPEHMDAGAGANLDSVQREDEDVVERVQRGLKSRLYPSGRFSPSKEPGVHHFHRMLADLLG
jgi:choline monooxygenase